MQAKNNNDHYDYTMIYYDDYNSNRFLLCYNNMQLSQPIGSKPCNLLYKIK